jgi:hypothetical protein
VCIEGRGSADQYLDSDTEPTQVALAHQRKTTYGRGRESLIQAHYFREFLELSSLSYVFCTEDTE